MDIIFQKTRELGQALLESEQYKKVQAAEAKAMKNAEAAALMALYMEKRAAVQAMMNEENPDPMAMKRLSDEMDDAQEKLQLVDDITELTQAREEFNVLIGQINQVLQFIVTGRMDDGEGCTGNCSSCGGCH